MTTAAEGHVSEPTFGPAEAASLVADLLTEQERPAHLARCRDCSVQVTYRPTASGAGFTVLKHSAPDIDVTFGISAAGLPMCPDGHGEMELADEQLPVGEAFAKVAEQLAEPEQVALPGVFPAFNYQGAYEECEAKAVEVAALRAQYEDDAETAKDSKKAWEKAADTLNKMLLEFRRRRREKAEKGGTSATDTIADPCRFEQLNPGVPCPICTDAERLAASTVLPASEEHGVEARDYLARLELQRTRAQLEAIDVFISLDELGALSLDLLSSVQDWALEATEHPDARKPFPPGVGRPHVAPNGHISEAPLEEGGSATNYQSCTTCGARISTLTEDNWKPYPMGALVGTDCQGPEVNHRYPDKKKKATRRKSAGE